MRNVEQDIKCVKQLLTREFEVGQETNKGYSNETNELQYKTRTIDIDELAPQCNLSNGHFNGILDLLVTEGFIKGRGVSPVYDVQTGIIPGEYRVEVYFQNDFKGVSNLDVSQLPEVYFDEKSGVGSTNGKSFTLELNSDSYKLFSLLYSQPGQAFGRDDILSALGISEIRKEDATLKINDIVKHARKTTGLSREFLVSKGGNLILRMQVPDTT